MKKSLAAVLSFLVLTSCASVKSTAPQNGAKLCTKAEFNCDFTVYDRNGSNTIERVEFEDIVAQYFDSLDTNHDGMIQANELNAQSGWHTKVSDKNHDGVISIVEFMASADVLFDKADLNKDRKLDRQEFASIHPDELVDSNHALPRVCVGDFNGKLTHWKLSERRPHGKLQQVYATLIPAGQRWTCVPLATSAHSHSKKYVMTIEAANSEHLSSCEVPVAAGNWVEAKENKGQLDCELFSNRSAARAQSRHAGKPKS